MPGMPLDQVFEAEKERRLSNLDAPTDRIATNELNRV